MLNLKYLDTNTTDISVSYEVEFHYISPNIIELSGRFPIQTTGFILSRPDQEDNWNYSDFNTVYRTLENSVQFSNDGSIYVEPEQPPEYPDMPFEPYEPTPEELETIFKQNKINKIALSKTLLAEYLQDNPLHSSVRGGVEGIYSVTSEKQTLMMSQYMTYQIEKSIDSNAKLTWNETGKSCVEWNEEEFLQLILEIKAYVYPLVSHQQHIEEEIFKCKTQDELESIIIDYSTV